MNNQTKANIDQLNSDSWSICRINPSLGLKKSQEAEALSLYYDYSEGLGYSLLNKGWNLFTLAKFPEANTNFDKAKKVFQNSNNIEGLLKANAGLSGILFHIGNFNECLSINNQSISIAKKENLIDREVTSLTSSLMVYIQLENYSDALKCGLEAMELGVNLDYFEQEPIILNSLADIYMELGDYDIAAKRLKKAYDIYKKRKEYQGEFECLCSLGKLYAIKSETKKAEAYFLKSVDKSQGSPLEDSVLLDTAEFYYSIGQQAKAVELLKASFGIAKKIKANNSLKKIYKLLSQIYEAKGDDEKALQYYKEYTNYTKLVEVENSDNNLSILKTQVKLEELKQENKKLTEKNTILEAIANIGRDITSSLDPKRLAELVYSNLEKIMDISTFGLAYYNEDLNSIDYKIFVEDGNYLSIDTLKLDNEDSFASWAIRNRNDIIISDYNSEYQEYIDSQNSIGLKTQSLLFLLIYYDRRIIGLLTVQSTKPCAYSSEDIKILELIKPYLSIAINNSLEHRGVKELKNRLEKSYREIQDISDKDFLTGLYNRRYFSKVINTDYLLKLKEKSMALIFIDIDYFKIVNITHGHRFGDAVLESLSKRLEDIVGKESALIRWGGEEFLLLLQDKALKDIFDICSNILKRISNKEFAVDRKEIKLTASIGFSYLPASEELYNDINWENITNIAESALLKAKQSGRNCIVGYSGNRYKDFTSLEEHVFTAN